MMEYKSSLAMASGLERQMSNCNQSILTSEWLMAPTFCLVYYTTAPLAQVEYKCGWQL
ncbi:hypothetical protein M3699_10760 [Peribacillus simplex]|uniref:hypothetical protein n=1 Tax=Peribacillus simplex TaxID=1478 RepID=UPI002040C833|nr:hypothetical protein [Peribacillus simplex]MCM3674354.1 hypothetical protein [Peribacillus simplex]